MMFGLYPCPFIKKSSFPQHLSGFMQIFFSLSVFLYFLITLSQQDQTNPDFFPRALPFIYIGVFLDVCIDFI